MIHLYRTRKVHAKSIPPSLVGKVQVRTAGKSARRSRLHIDFNDISVYAEKPGKVTSAHRSWGGERAGWVPHIRACHTQTASVREHSGYPEPKTTAAPNPLSVDAPADMIRSLEVIRSPPPSYFAPDVRPSMVPIIPPASITDPFHAHVTPSPRDESFASQTVFPPPQGPYASDKSTAQLPRFMSVTGTFTPSLADELSIQIGGVVSMLEEYRDGWCLVQRVGMMDSPKGAVPRFCLEELGQPRQGL